MTLDEQIRAIVRDELSKANAPRITAKSLRIKAGWNQKELAERAGVGAATVARIEAGLTKHPSPEVVRKIGAALGCKQFAEIACK